MTTSVGTQVHFDPADVGHKYKRGGHATLDFTGSGSTYLYLHCDTPAKIDAVIAELVALKQEMDPPAERELPKVYASPCTDEGEHEPCDGITGLCDCDCHVFAASVIAS